MAGNSISRGNATWCRVEVSSTVRDVHRPAGVAAARTGGMAPARLGAVLARQQAGFYDRPDVLRRVAQRVALELDASA